MSIPPSFSHTSQPCGQSIINNLLNLQINRYNLSKLLEIYAIQEIADQVAASAPQKGPVVVNHSNPGWVKTEVMREWSGLRLLIFLIMRAIFARSTEVGSRTTVNAVEGGEETHGQFLDDCQIGE